MTIKMGELYVADLSGALYSEQGKTRPVIIMQNDTGNLYSPTTIIVPLTSKIKKTDQPTHVLIRKCDAIGLTKDSVALCEQIRTIDKKRIKNRIGTVNKDVMKNIFYANQANFGNFDGEMS